MSTVSPSPSPDFRHRAARFLTSVGGRLLVMALLLAFMVAWLRILGQPYVCECGTVRLWQDMSNPAENSQQFADWFSLLHVILGISLYAALHALRPTWSTQALLPLAIASSVLWEAMENTPALIAMFDGATNAPPYQGDSVLNALGDTLFVAIGFHAASMLPVALTLALVVGLEAAVAHGADDGFIIGTLRLLGVRI